jgi:uncharacterized membrane protein
LAKAHVKKYLSTGLLILVPLAITLWVLNLIVTTMDQTLLLLPESVRTHAPFNYPGMGVVLTLAVVLGTGLLGRNFIGRRLVVWWEALLRRIPVVSSIYTSVKQVSDTLFSPSGQAFRKAVLVQFPREGAWTVAFVVGDPGEHLKRPLSPDHLTVYVPTAPNPTSGYVLILAAEDIVDLDISVDDALKFVVSMGVVSPSRKAIIPSPRSVPLVPPM